MKPFDKTNKLSVSVSWRVLACWCILVPFLALGQAALPKPARIVTAYALTSAQDFSNTDPEAWRLLASNDDGRSWTTLDVQTNQPFRSRSQRRVFAVNNQTAYNAYRLQLDNATDVALAELELMGPAVGVTNEDELQTIITASGEQPLIGPAIQAFDGDPTTKWIDFGTSGSAVRWLECQYALQSELLVTNVGQFLVVARRMANRNLLLDRAPQVLSNLTYQANKPLRTLTGYALSSANDNPCRDPRDWKLLGSNDGGKSWDALDERRNEIFTARFQRRSFALAKPATYVLYRLQIDSIRVPGAYLADSVQLAQIEPLYDTSDLNHRFSVVVSAQGENPPMELAIRAFDDDLKTKWLDFGEAPDSQKSGSNSNRASWIQWQYMTGTDVPVIDLRWLRTVRGRPAPPVKLQLEGVVASWNSRTKTLGFLDDTGFQLFELDSFRSDVRYGERIRLTGQPRCGGEVPKVLKPEVVVLGSLPAVSEIRPEQALDGGQGFLVGTTEGIMTSVSEDSVCLELHLAAKDGSGYIIVKTLNPGRTHVHFFPGCRLRATGVVQSVFDQSGKQVAGVLWAPDLDHLQLAPSTEQEWSAWPEYSVENLRTTNLGVSLGAPIRLRGTLIEQGVNKTTLVGKGNSRFVAYSTTAVRLAPGVLVEAIGFLGSEDGTPVVQFAQIRPINNSEAAAPKEAIARAVTDAPLTNILQVNEFIAKEPGKALPVRMRGVITYIDPGLGSFYIQEGEQAIQVNGLLATGLGPFLQQEGLYVEVRGQTVTNQPAITATSVATVLGRGRMPEPMQHSWDYLMTGRDFSQWVAIEGVIREVGEHRLVLALRGGKLAVQINEMEAGNQNRWLGSLVRICGVCAPVANNRNTRLGIRLLVPSMEQVQVLKEAPEDPFALPMQPIAKLLGSGSENGVQGVRWVKTSGVVTYSEPRLLFVQNNEDGLCVAPRNDVLVEPGDRVEVVGFAEPDGFSPRLVQALVKVVGRGELPEASPVNLLETELSGHDAKRGLIEGIVLGLITRESLQILELRDEKRDKTISAFFPTQHGVLPSIPAGSRVRVQGVVKAEADALQDAGEVISSFKVFGNSPTDVTILQRPSWWTTRRTLWTSGALAGVLFVSLAWAGLLRKQVRLRTQELRAEIDERKRAEEALQSSRAQLQLQIDRMPIGCITWSPEFRVTSWNPAAEKMFGYPAQEALGKHACDLIVPKEVQPRVEGIWRHLLEGELSAHSVNNNQTKDGRTIICDWTNTPLRAADGDFLAVLSMVQDVTERKHAEAELAHERDLLNTLLDNSPDVIYFKDLESRFVRYSKSFGELFQLADPEVLRGKTDFDFFTEEHARPAYEDEQEIIRTGKPILRKIEKETHPDGRITWALTSKLPWHDKDGKTIGTFGLSQSITSIKETEAKLQAVHKQLLQVSRQAGMAEVATSVLHNVGNVLNSINVAVTLVDEHVRKSRAADLNRLVKLLSDHTGDLGAFLTADPRGQKVPEFLGQLADRLAAEQALVLTELASLRKNVEHIKEIVAMQQSYAKVSGVIERIEIAELAEDTLRMNAASFARHDVRVVREYSPVPPINTDKHKVLQILINLVRNAKYACDESGRSDKQVTVRVDNGDDRVRISVIDNGVGVRSENLTRIFNHGFTTRKDGHGFGLHSGALAAKELGGTFTAQSDGPGKGATFALELPKNLSHAPNASEAHSQP